jgi:filamentous hemagglutinin
MLQGYDEGSFVKTLMHAASGGLGSLALGGSFASGALAAGTRELLAPLSADAPDSLQRFVSSLIGMSAGALAGGERGASIGYSVALSGEIYNRQLHQREIEWIEDHAGEFDRAGTKVATVSDFIP